MKNWLSNLFGDDADEPAVSTPPRSPEDLKLDAIWARYLAITSHPTDYQPRREDRPGITQDWPQKLREDRRFIMALFPVKYALDGTWSYPKFWPFPLRSAVRAAGGFEPYCRSDSFLEFLRPHVAAWQLDAIEWNRMADSSPHHEESAIRCPEIDVYLLDPDGPGLDKVRIPRWPFPPPKPPAPTFHPIPRPPPDFSLGHVLPLKKKKKGLSH